MSEFSELIEQNLRFRQRAFELVTVAAQFPDEEAKVLKFLQDKHASTKNYIFADTDKYALIEAFDKDWNGELPYTLLIDEKGKVLYRESGSIDFLMLLDDLKTLFTYELGYYEQLANVEKAVAMLEPLVGTPLK